MPSESRPDRFAPLEADIALTRARLGVGLTELRGKLTPTGLAQEAQTRLQRSQNPTLQALSGQLGRSARTPARMRPLTTLLGAGLAWLLLRSSRHREEV
jgi:hypothetical protein